MRKLRVGFIEFYRQWPGYFTDTFNAAYAGALSEAGHDARIFRIFLHERSQEVILEAHQALTAAGPFDVLVFDRVWDGALLRDVVTAAGAPHVLVLQWESSAQWPEVTARISPISRDALLAYAEAIATDVAPTSECIPNLFTRDENGAWRPPKSLVPLEIKRELRAPLTLGHDRAAHFGLPEEAYRRTRYLVLNMGCPYRGAENTSDFLDGLDLPTSWGAAGCTFCNVGPYERQRREERLALMENQLAALALHGDYDRLVVQDEYIFRDLDTLVEVVMRHAAAPVEIMVRARVDYIDSCRDALVRALEELGEFGTITPYLVGFENFSDAELQRYNKGQTRAQSITAAQTLFALADRYPNLTLSPSQGFILFGPWTTLDDLDANIDAFRTLGFNRLRGALTRSKLRLNPDAALVARARADGLLIAAYDERSEDNAQETGYQAELPYRFAHDATARVWELLNGPNPTRGESEIDRLARAVTQARAEAAS